MPVICDACARFTCTCDTPTGAPTDRAFLVGCIQEAWFKRALIQPRGFDSQRRRAELAAEVDDYLDELFALMETTELEAAL